jgi:hypothetical protein
MCKVDATENTGVTYGRGTCTDKTWNSPFCPPMCQFSESSGIVAIANRSRPLTVDVIDQDTLTNSSAYDFGTGPVPIWECGAQGYAKEAEYCCESQAERQRCCSTSSAVFRVPGATLGAFTGLPPSLSVGSTTGSAFTVTSTASSTLFSPAPSSTNTQAGSIAEKDNNGMKLGAGIGGGLGGLLLIAAGVVLFLWQKRRKQKVAESFQHEFKRQDNEEVNAGYGPVELPTSHDPRELHSREIPQELPQELPAEEIVDELPLRT